MNRVPPLPNRLYFDHEDIPSQLQLLFFEKGISSEPKLKPPAEESPSSDISNEKKLILVLHGADSRFFMELKNFIANNKWREVPVSAEDTKVGPKQSNALTEPSKALFPESDFLQPVQWFLMNVNKEIEKKLEVESFGLQDLASNMGMCAMQLHRKLKKLAGLSPAIYIRTYRLHRSLDFLKDKRLNITQVAFRVGFRSLEYFSRSFKQEFGTCPSAFQTSC